MKPTALTLLCLSLALLIITPLPAAISPSADQDITLTSPDGKLSLTVGITAESRLAYRIQADGKPIIENSPLGLTIDGIDLGQGVTLLSKPTTTSIDETYPIFGNHPTARNHCNQATIPLRTGDRSFNLIVRAYDDGAALRYEVQGNVEKVSSESTAWNLPRTGRYTWSPFNNSYEDLVHTTAWDMIPPNALLSPPLTAEVNDHIIAISEAACDDFPDMGLMRNGTTFLACFPTSRAGFKVDSAGLLTPWRVTLVARDLTALVNSDLFTNLCPAPDAKMDFSWVKPGRCMWQWCSIGAPQFNDQHDWYNATAELKWEYYLIDEGWRNWSKEETQRWAMLKEVIDYGNSKGIKSLVWVNSNEMRTPEASRAYLEKVKACGAVGIKIDFFPPATREVIRWQMNLLRQTAELHLLCNFHGAVKPTGMRRTWPHELTREAVRGDEYHMTRFKRVRPPELDCNQPFNRLLQGPADITPVVLDPKQLGQYTWPHMIAQGIVFLSPVTHYYDRYQFYVESPAKDLLQDVPVVWDETRVLPGTEIGQIVAFARRSGNTWWIAVMNGGSPRQLNIPLDFLKSPGKAVLLYDAQENAALDRQEKTLAPADTLKLDLRPTGGFVARIIVP